jgi:hypothetical protein
MRTRVDERLEREAARFAFRFACEDCVHFEHERGPERERGSRTLEESGPERERGSSGRCSLGYPAAPRREALQRTYVALCKSYELI